MGPQKLTPRRGAARRSATALAALACAALLAPAAGASPASDLAAVLKDFQSDRDIKACLFTKKQLEGVKRQVAADADAYAPEFKTEINREIGRWNRGECSGKALSGSLRIVTAKGKGSARRESVTLKNVGSRRINVRGYALRNRAGKKIRLKSSRLAKGRTLRVITGCAKGKRRPSRKGSRYYACKTKQHWNDKRDVAELLRPGGKVVARKRTT